MPFYYHDEDVINKGNVKKEEGKNVLDEAVKEVKEEPKKSTKKKK